MQNQFKYYGVSDVINCKMWFVKISQLCKELEDINRVFDRSAEKFVLENIKQNDTLEI